MNPSNVKSALRLLGLSIVLLLLATAVVVSVAVVVWNSDAAWRWRQCQARARNETGRLVELEKDARTLRMRLEESARKETHLLSQLDQANQGLWRLNGALAACQNQADMLQRNLTNLENATAAALMEYTDAETRNEVLQADLDRWKAQAAELTLELEGARWDHYNVTQGQQGLKGQLGECRGRNGQLQDAMTEYVAEIEKLHRQLSSGSVGTGWQCPWHLVGLIASSILMFNEVFTT
ncbi:coiled-coil domain-containing protein 194 [Lissotriton helveticus]